MLNRQQNEKEEKEEERINGFAQGNHADIQDLLVEDEDRRRWQRRVETGVLFDQEKNEKGKGKVGQIGREERNRIGYPEYLEKAGKNQGVPRGMHIFGNRRLLEEVDIHRKDEIPDDSPTVCDISSDGGVLAVIGARNLSRVSRIKSVPDDRR